MQGVSDFEVIGFRPSGRVAFGAVKLTREQRSAFFRDDFPKITYPGAKPCPVVVGETYWLSSLRRLVVTKIRRSKKGEWVVVYELHVREPGIFLAARAPRADTEREREKFTEAQARGYTHSRSESLDRHAEAVYFVSDNDPILVEARKRFAEHRHANAREEQVDENARQVARQIRDLAVAIQRAGGDSVAFLADFQRQISAKRDEMRDAA